MPNSSFMHVDAFVGTARVDVYNNNSPVYARLACIHRNSLPFSDRITTERINNLFDISYNTINIQK